MWLPAGNTEVVSGSLGGGSGGGRGGVGGLVMEEGRGRKEGTNMDLKKSYWDPVPVTVNHTPLGHHLTAVETEAQRIE